LSPLLSAFSKLEKNSQCLSDMMLPLEKIEWNLNYQWVPLGVCMLLFIFYNCKYM
jgi:hypothetical protein